MLTTLARRVRGRRSLTRRVITVVTVALGVIFGLLAMHSLNTHATASGHSDTVAVGSVTQTHHEHTAAAATLPSDDTGCVGCSEDDGMTWMACVLALLVAVVLLARPAAWWHSLSQSTVPHLPSWAQPTGHPLRPPSLTVLCISRT